MTTNSPACHPDEEEPGVEFVPVYLFDSAGNLLEYQWTDANGYYLFDHVEPGTYKVIYEAPNGYAFADASADSYTFTQPVTIESADDAFFDFDIALRSRPTGGISGSIFNDLNGDGDQDAGEPGTPDVEVSLFTDDGFWIEDTTTDANGNYGFSNLLDGDYYLEFVNSEGNVLPPQNHHVSTGGITGNTAPAIHGAETIERFELASNGVVEKAIADLVGGAVDPDSDPLGIAITEAVDGWEYLFDDDPGDGIDGVWRAIGQATEFDALLLPADSESKIRFVGDPSTATSIDDALEYLIWDQFSGIAGARAATTQRGGSAAFSAEKAVIALFKAPNNNQAPTAINLDNSSVLEESFSVVGSLSTVDPDNAFGDVHSYAVDDERFEIVDNELRLSGNAILDFEIEPTVTLTVTSTDLGGLSNAEVMTITVIDGNDTPTGVVLTNDAVDENSVGAVIGSLEVIDPNIGDSHTIEVFDTRFEIVNGNLKLVDGASLDYETTSEIPLAVFVTDDSGASHFTHVTVQVNDVNETPTAIDIATPEVTSIGDGQYIPVPFSFQYPTGYAAKLVHDTSGNYLSVWEQSGTEGWGLYGQWTNVGSDLTESPVLLGTPSSGTLYYPTIATSDDGNILLAWGEYGIDQFGNTGYFLTAQAFHNDLSPCGTPFQISDSNGSLLGAPSVIPGANGEFLVVWSGYTSDLMATNVYARRISADAWPVGSQFQVNTSAGGYDTIAAYGQAGVVDQGGNTLIVWNHADGQGNSHVQMARRFDWNGAPLGDEFVLDDSNPISGGPIVTMFDSGASAVAWEQTSGGGTTTDIYLQRFDENGMPDGSRVRVNTENGSNAYTSLAVNDDDQLGIAWLHDGQVAARWFEANGLPVGDQFHVNDLVGIGASANMPMVHAATDNIFVVTWKDGSSNSYYNRHFEQLPGTALGENMDGAVVGLLTVDDPDEGDTHTWAVDDSRFEVVAEQLKLKGGEALDFETEPSVTVTVTITDSGNLSFGRQFTFDIVDVNEAPIDLQLDNLTVPENFPGGAVGGLTTTDQDQGDSHTYNVDDSRFEVVGGQLRLKAGQGLDHETEAVVNLTVTATDGGGLSLAMPFAVAVDDVNEAPTDLALSHSTVDENDAGAVIGNLTVTDPDASDVYSYDLMDDRFEVVGGQLKLKAGESLDFEYATTVDVYITVTDLGDLAYGENFTLTVVDVNEAPTDIDMMVYSVTENESGVAVGYLYSTDPDSGDTVTYTLDDARFEVLGNDVYLKAGQSLDYETDPQVTITVTATDSGELWRAEAFTIYVYDVNEFPLDIQLDNTTVFEETPGAVIGNLSTVDDAGDFHWYLVDDPRFEIAGNQLQLANGQSLDFETEMMVNLTVTTTDSLNQSHQKLITIAVINVNEAPTAIEADGTLEAQGDGVQVSYGAGSYNASTAFDAAGNSVTVWQGSGDQGWGIYGRMYDAAGIALGDAIRLDEGQGSPSCPVVAMDDWGGFVVVWSDYGDDGFGNWDYRAYARGFAWGGMPMGAAVAVSDYDGNFSGRPTLVAGGPGDYVLVWSAYTPDYMGTNLYARRIDSWGNPTTSQVQLNSNSGYYYLAYYADAADVDQNGNFVVAWLDSSSYQHVVQKFDWFGNPLSGEVSFAPAYMNAPAVAMAETGEFVAAWEDSYAIYLQQFDATVMQVGGTQQVDLGTGYNNSAAVAMDGQGRFAVSWLDTYDSNNVAVWGRWYNASGAAITEPTLINEMTGTGYVSYGPHVTANQLGWFAITWSGYDTYVRTYEFSAAGVPTEISLWQSTPLTLDLSLYFDDPDLGDVLTFTVESNDDPAALSATIDGNDLILDALTGNSLTLNLTIRATDLEGLFAELTLTILLNQV